MSDHFGAAWTQGALRAQTANFQEAVAEINIRNERLRQAYAEIADLKQKLLASQLEAAVARSDAAGRFAQFEALKKAHPTSPLFSASGQTFSDGQAKTKIRVEFERAFDARIMEAARKNPMLGIVDPAVYRH